MSKNDSILIKERSAGLRFNEREYCKRRQINVTRLIERVREFLRDLFKIILMSFIKVRFAADVKRRIFN